MKDIKMIITDFDGTLALADNSVSKNNIDALHKLNFHNIIRVIATGRNLFSVKNVIPETFPIDYLFFSSGAGILDWGNKNIISSQSLSIPEVETAVELFLELNIDFMVHNPIPDNHYFRYYKTGKNNFDFENRINLHGKFSEPINLEEKINQASQLLGIIDENEIELFDEIKKRLSPLNVVRTTSPSNGKSIWVEVFPGSVSKGHAAEWLSNYLNISCSQTVTIGNDYNDIDLLEWSCHSFVVDNAAEILKEKYTVTDSNHNHGFASIVEKILSAKKNRSA